jgi:hypothetical protein
METRGSTPLAALPPPGSDNGHYVNQTGVLLHFPHACIRKLAGSLDHLIRQEG